MTIADHIERAEKELEVLDTQADAGAIIPHLPIAHALVALVRLIEDKIESDAERADLEADG